MFVGERWWLRMPGSNPGLMLLLLLPGPLALAFLCNPLFLPFLSKFLPLPLPYSVYSFFWALVPAPPLLSWRLAVSFCSSCLYSACLLSDLISIEKWTMQLPEDSTKVLSWGTFCVYFGIGLLSYRAWKVELQCPL